MFLSINLLVIINVILLNKILFKSIIKPNLLFTFIWCISVSIASLGLFNIYKLSLDVKIYSLIVVMSFNFIYYLISKKYYINNSSDIKINIRYKEIYILNILSWLYCTKFLIKSLNIIFYGGGLKVLRMYSYNSELGLGSTAELLILQIIIGAIFTSTIIISIALIVLKKVNYKMLLIAIVDLIVYTLLFGGRSYIFNFGLYYIFAYFIMKLYGNKVIKINKKLIIVCITFLVLLTIKRSWSDVNLLETIVWYFTGGFNNLSVLFLENKMPMYLYGKAILGFIINIVLMFFTAIFGIDYNGSDHIITAITSIQRNISPSIRTNANTTLIYPLFMDSGVIGIILGSIFLGGLVSIIEREFIKRKDVMFYCIYIYFLQILFNSIFNYSLLFPVSGVTLIFIIIFTRKKIRII